MLSEQLVESQKVVLDLSHATREWECITAPKHSLYFLPGILLVFQPLVVGMQHSVSLVWIEYYKRTLSMYAYTQTQTHIHTHT